MKNEDMISYYARRAREYEKVYDKSERQSDLARIRLYLPDLFIEKKVLEIGCGTGYWTRFIAQKAESILATDINQEVLELAIRKEFPRKNVAFQLSDMYQLMLPKERYEAVFAGFIWSHIPRQQLGEFLQSLRHKLSLGGKIVFLDNLYVEGSSHPITKTDPEGNTYQSRKLEDGSEHLVLKNFPNDAELMVLAKANQLNISIIRWEYYWLASFY